MSIVGVSARASARQYRIRFRCPICRKPYAKPKVGMRHLRDKHARDTQAVANRRTI